MTFIEDIFLWMSFDCVYFFLHFETIQIIHFVFKWIMAIYNFLELVHLSMFSNSCTTLVDNFQLSFLCIPNLWYIPFHFWNYYEWLVFVLYWWRFALSLPHASILTYTLNNEIRKWNLFTSFNSLDFSFVLIFLKNKYWVLGQSVDSLPYKHEAQCLIPRTHLRASTCL